MSTKPLIGMTMGDPAGIGPEITTSVAFEQIHSCASDVLLIANTELVKKHIDLLEIDTTLIRHKYFERKNFDSNALNVFDPDGSDLRNVKTGRLDKIAGEASMLFNRHGAKLAISGLIDGLVTAPVTKASTKMAGYNFPGQAEYFSHLAGGIPFTTILIYKGFKAALFTTHMPLIEACKSVKKEALIKKIKFLHENRFQLGYPNLNMAVASLNPHAGESGTMGSEEIEHIQPAIACCKKEGIQVNGPFPVNALISPPYDGRGFDLTLALYHDQVVCRMNMLETTTLTFGLPFIRTSVGHGSALDIAGTGKADHNALMITLNHTVELARLRNSVLLAN